MHLEEIRKNYFQGELDESQLEENPFALFEKWLADAFERNESEPTAMTIATVDEEHKPHARMVLLKEMTPEGFCFFTNYESHKAQQLFVNKHVALVFYWPSIERQVRIEGIAKKMNEESSTDYFHKRPLESQLGAWASPQSRIIPSRQLLEHQFNEYRKKFGEQVPKPPFWGGFLISPTLFEFWQGRPNRLHDRIEYVKAQNQWQMHRLAP
ncbi:MAG: pyridoxamine 5'-phosphate oxidase [Microbacter sp.]